MNNIQENVKTNLPTQGNIELKLPMSGYTVVLKPFLTIGQSRELQCLLLESDVFDVNTQKFTGKNSSSVLKMQDKTLEFLGKEIKDSTGKILPFTLEFIAGLPQQDGQLIYAKADEISNASNLTAEAKKK